MFEFHVPEYPYKMLAIGIFIHTDRIMEIPTQFIQTFIDYSYPSENCLCVFIVTAED